MRVLFETLIGSHVWGMEHSNSDIDIFRCYQVGTKEILKRGVGRGKFVSEGGSDTQESEVGTVVQQLVKNNLNYLVSVMSPHVKVDSLELIALRSFVPRCLSIQLFHSFHGMAVHNYQKYLSEDGDAVPEWRLNKIARVLVLGVKLLKGMDFAFESFHGADRYTIEMLTKELSAAFIESKLPVKCPIEEEMLDWLVELRLRYL